MMDKKLSTAFTAPAVTGAAASFSSPLSDLRSQVGSLPMSSTSTSPATQQSSTMVPSSEPSLDSATSALSSSDPASGQVSCANDHVFVVHSLDSLENRRPPDIDNKTLARQKRKRTSPEDQATLEFAYQRNPKPDRATRMRIVEQVALGEKEVQIWFQNRRQNTRRKSRPAELNVTSAPCGLDAFANNSGHRTTRVSTTAMVEGENTDQIEHNNIPNPLNIQFGNRLQLKRSSSYDCLKTFQKPSLVSSVSESGAKRPRPVSTFKRTASDIPLSPDWVGLQTEHAKSPATLQELISSTSSSAGYFANRRNIQRINQVDRMDGNDQSQADMDYQANMSSQSSNKSSSLVRLSMTSNGRAKVVTEVDLSPPKKTPVPIDTDPFASSELRTHDKNGSILAEASLSIGPDNKGSSATMNTVSGSARGVPKLRSGRSRDSRAWEFWCDADARNALSQKADKEWSGSAADAIGLMRSSSKADLRRRASGDNGFGKRNRHVLAEVSNKRQKSVLFTNSEGTGRHSKILSKERRLSKLKRNASAYGRMQSIDGIEIMGKGLKGRKESKLAVKDVLLSEDGIEGKEKNTRKEDDEFEVAQTDSDKENWDPEGTSYSYVLKRRNGKINKAGMQPSEDEVANANVDAELNRKTQKISDISLKPLSQDDHQRLKMRVDRRRRRNMLSSKGCDGSEAGGKDDPEVARFMSGGRIDVDGDDGSRCSRKNKSAHVMRWSTVKSAPAVEEADMHCVESLLSLSKGTWVSSV